MTGKRKSLLSIVQERALTKKRAEEEKRWRELNSIPYLPNDCVCNILLRLDIESLQRARFVCKPWYRIANIPNFIESHLSTSENTIIFLAKEPEYEENPFTFSVEDNVVGIRSLPIFKRPIRDPKTTYHMRYLDIRGSKSEILDYHITCLGQIRGSCNGLVLLDNEVKKGGLILLNPVTRKMLVLPLGTISSLHEESYGLVYCKSKKEYKLVHLFRDKSGYVSCEILDIASSSWRAVDGPTIGLISWFGHKPFHAIGALHWLPNAHQSEYVLSMGVEDEKFHHLPLPKRCEINDGIVEIGGLLGFVSHEGMYRIDLWILTSLSGEEWEMQHSIDASPNRVVDMVPLCCTRIDGEMVFRSHRDSSIHTYDFESGAIKRVELKRGTFHQCYIPHVNSLVSWQTHGGDEDMDY